MVGILLSLFFILLGLVVVVVVVSPWPLHVIAHYQYYIAYLAMKGGGGDMTYGAIVWAMRGGEGGTRTQGLFAKNIEDSCTKAST